MSKMAFLERHERTWALVLWWVRAICVLVFVASIFMICYYARYPAKVIEEDPRMCIMAFGAIGGFGSMLITPIYERLHGVRFPYRVSLRPLRLLRRKKTTLHD